MIMHILRITSYNVCYTKLLRDISELVRNYLKDNGVLITSGIIKDRKDDVLNHYRALGYSVSIIDELGEWVAICFNA